MSQTFNLAIVGGGSSGANATHALYASGQFPIEKLVTTIFDNGSAETCGRGFAYGPRGAILGNLTEAPSDGSADYHKWTEGQFGHYAGARLGIPASEIHTATRQLIGEFHTHRFQTTAAEVAARGGSLIHRSAYVTEVRPTQHGFSVVSNDAVVGHADHVALAIGDVLSTRFDSAIKAHPGRVFQTPYHAVETILENNGKERTIVAFGSRSSAVDLVNGLALKGYEGKIILVSTSGQTSWLARQGRNSYPLQFLHTHPVNPAPFKTVKEVLRALESELKQAQSDGAYVPSSLIESVRGQQNSDSPSRLKWNFDLKREADHADDRTYHEVAMAVNWGRIYRSLDQGDKTAKEREKFKTVLGDFIQYNRVNRIVPRDYREFVGHVAAGRAEIRKGSFGPEDISQLSNGKLQVQFKDGSKIETDYVVNSAIGPGSSQEALKSVPVLAQLERIGLIQAGQGTGFVPLVSGISFLGAQARVEPFNSIGIQTNGRHAVDNWVKPREREILAAVTSRQPFSLEHCPRG